MTPGKPNGFGLYNMHGNVWEWCMDVYDERFYKSPDAVRSNPLCTSGSRDRVIRGGSWSNVAWYCRSAFRHMSDPLYRGSRIGFRPAYYPLP